MGQARFRPHLRLRVRPTPTGYTSVYRVRAALAAPPDSRTRSRTTKPRYRRARFLPAPSKFLFSVLRGGDGDGSELRRSPRPSLCIGEVREPPPSGARLRPSPLRLPPRRRLLGPFQSTADGAGGSLHLGAQLCPPFSTRNIGFQVSIKTKRG